MARAVVWFWRALIGAAVALSVAGSPSGQVLYQRAAAAGGPTRYSARVDLVAGAYSVAGVGAAALTGLPGFTFTRSGQETCVDSTGFVTYAAANTPCITDLGLSMWESRTNTAQFSSQLDSTFYHQTATGLGVTPTVTANAGIAPDGSVTAERIQFNLGGGTSNLDRSIFGTISNQSDGAPLDNVTRTRSIWLKSNTASTYVLILRHNSPQILATVTPTWQRFQVAGASTSDGTSAVELRGAAGTSATADILAWGNQVEVGAMASPLIPTTNASATRGQATATISFSALPSSGLLSAEVSRDHVPAQAEAFGGLSDGTTANRIEFLQSNGTAVASRYVAGGVATNPPDLSGSFGVTTIKAAMAYGPGRAVTSVNGALGPTSAPSATPAVNQINLGIASNGGSPLNGWLRRLYLRPGAYSDGQVMAATR